MKVQVSVLFLWSLFSYPKSTSIQAFCICYSDSHLSFDWKNLWSIMVWIKFKYVVTYYTLDLVVGKSKELPYLLTFTHEDV